MTKTKTMTSKIEAAEIEAMRLADIYEHAEIGTEAEAKAFEDYETALASFDSLCADVKLFHFSY